MYIFFIVLIFIASILLVLTVLAQNPKSGMAANFGASNAVMGVRGTADFLERFTWVLSIAIVVLCLAATVAMPSADKAAALNQQVNEQINQQASLQAGEGITTLPISTQNAAEIAEEAAEAGE